MSGVRLHAVFSSDLERARRTADAVAAATGVTVTPEPGLREVGLGQWEGIDRRSLQRDYASLYEQWTTRPSWDLVPDGEGTDAFRKRVLAALARIVAGRADDETVAAVTHIGVIRLVLSMAAGLESTGLRWPWAIDNTAITTLAGPPDPARWSSPALVISAINDAVHLRDEAAA
jgi:2,3-bisphosphoglycerate-dependent phosphoglycerate mutase